MQINRTALSKQTFTLVAFAFCPCLGFSFSGCGVYFCSEVGQLPAKVRRIFHSANGSGLD